MNYSRPLHISIRFFRGDGFNGQPSLSYQSPLNIFKICEEAISREHQPVSKNDLATSNSQKLTSPLKPDIFRKLSGGSARSYE
ncbi:MAG: hypothetical protein AMJ41_04415 [candidate division Zixibacteria bacterium DG_27]|nr:MAG: hypothetical protein AMJ41_04415 [candidate division Zixibacteria bacterium DG_27]